MAGKIVQLDMWNKEKAKKEEISLPEFQQTVVSSYKALFARYGDLVKKYEQSQKHCEVVEQMVWNMHNRVDHLAEAVMKNV